MSVSGAAPSRVRVRHIRTRTAYNELHIRLAPQEIDAVEDVARELGVPIAPTVRLLVGLGIESRRRPAPTATEGRESERSTEMLLHLLVAVEQVLALIESFLPEGPGAADAARPAAALSAQRRLAASEVDPAEEREP